jgi:hypothetical protein
MITVSIGSAERQIEDVTPDWVHEQISRRTAAGESVCIRLRIDDPRAVMTLTTEDCPPGSSNTRLPNQLELRLFEIWKQHDLNGHRVNSGHLISFLARLRAMF